MWDFLVIGAGPAGLKAGIKAAENGIGTKVIDEFPKPGGRLLGQLYQDNNGEWWNGIKEAEALVRKAESLNINIECGLSVYDLESKEDCWVVHTENSAIQTKHLLLATGASEKHFPLPGWTLPGTMSIGAAQVMSNVHRVKPGDNCIVIGVNVLSLSIAEELNMCGVNVKAIVLPVTHQIEEQAAKPQEVISRLMNLTHLAPSRILKILGSIGKLLPANLIAKIYPKQGIKMNGIPIKLKTAAQEIVGQDTVEGVELVDIDKEGVVIPKTEKIEQVDVVCISGGLTPLAELASVAGCEFKYVEALGGYVPVHNEKMETSISNLYVAGNITGVESAKVAMAQGEVAGLSVVKKQFDNNEIIVKQVDDAIEKVKRVRDEALIQFQPHIDKERTKLYQQSVEN